MPFLPSAERYLGFFVMSILCYAHKIDITFSGNVGSYCKGVLFYDEVKSLLGIVIRKTEFTKPELTFFGI
jgi:hypothetical protein